MRLHDLLKHGRFNLLTCFEEVVGAQLMGAGSAAAGLLRTDAEQFLRPLGKSSPSVRDTLVHLLAEEWLWLERWRGRSPRVWRLKSFPPSRLVCDRWNAVEQEMKRFLSALPEETLEQPMTCMSTRGNQWT
jgi:uncharacterized damage-inducible protein DinB